MVEDMDEAAVYGSPMYRLLDNSLIVEPPEREETELSDIARGDTPPTANEATTTAKMRTFESSCDETAEVGATGCETGGSIDFGSAWERYRRGEIGSGRVLAVLTRIHGDALGATWPLVVSALPSDEVSLPCIARVHLHDSVLVDRGSELP